MPGLFKSGRFILEIVMFDKVKAYPNGVIEYYYKDEVVVEGKNLVSTVKRKYDKDLYGAIYNNNDIPDNILKFIPN